MLQLKKWQKVHEHVSGLHLFPNLWLYLDTFLSSDFDHEQPSKTTVNPLLLSNSNLKKIPIVNLIDFYKHMLDGKRCFLSFFFMSSDKMINDVVQT